MDKVEIKKFFNKINKLKLTKTEKERMLNKFQVRGKNKVSKIMTFKEFSYILKQNKGNITFLALGPDWNRLVFADIDVDL